MSKCIILKFGNNDHDYKESLTYNENLILNDNLLF